MVLKDGKEIRTKTVSEAVKHGIAYVTEDRKHYGLNLIDTINRNISLSALARSPSAVWSTSTRSGRSPRASASP